MERIKLKIKTVVNSVQSLGVLGDLEGLNGKVTYGISRMLSSVNPVLESFNKAKAALVKKYGETAKDKDGKEIGREIKAENRDIFETEIDGLLDGEEEIILYNIPLSALLDDKGNCKVDAIALSNLEWCIKE